MAKNRWNKQMHFKKKYMKILNKMKIKAICQIMQQSIKI